MVEASFATIKLSNWIVTNLGPAQSLTAWKSWRNHLNRTWLKCVSLRKRMGAPAQEEVIEELINGKLVQGVLLDHIFLEQDGRPGSKTVSIWHSGFYRFVRSSRWGLNHDGFRVLRWFPIWLKTYKMPNIDFFLHQKQLWKSQPCAIWRTP